MQPQEIKRHLDAQGIEYWHRKRDDKVFVQDVSVSDIVEGVLINYQRRRYENTFYTWVMAYCGEWVSLGDPWPCSRPKRSEIIQAIQLAKGVQC